MKRVDGPFKVTPNKPADAERAARLQDFWNWKYNTDAEFKKEIDDALLWDLLFTGPPPPEGFYGLGIGELLEKKDDA